MSASRSKRPPRRVYKHNADSRRTKAQADYIRQLRKKAGEPHGPVPHTRQAAANEIDRLRRVLGKKPRSKAAKPRTSSDAGKVEVSIARDLARDRQKEDLRDEQARLKAEAAARRQAAR